jgi:hypothetical protein
LTPGLPPPTRFAWSCGLQHKRPRRRNTRFLFFAQAGGTVVSKLVGEVVTDPTGPYDEVMAHLHAGACERALDQ